MGREKTLSAPLQLQHDAGLILSNLQVLQHFVTSLNRMSAEVMRVAFDRELFPSEAVQTMALGGGGEGGGGGSVTIGQRYICNYGPQWWGWVFHVYSPQ